MDERDALRVVVFTGLPGTSKSTLADLTAQRLQVPAFAGDWLLGALSPARDALAVLDRATYLELYRGLLRSLITRQLILGMSAIVDCVVDDSTLAEWRSLTEDHSGAMFVIECVCSSQRTHRSRVEGRSRGIPGWHEIDWDHVLRMRAEHPELKTERLQVDSMQPLPSNADAVLHYVGVEVT